VAAAAAAAVTAATNQRLLPLLLLLLWYRWRRHGAAVVIHLSAVIASIGGFCPHGNNSYYRAAATASLAGLTGSLRSVLLLTATDSNGT